MPEEAEQRFSELPHGLENASLGQPEGHRRSGRLDLPRIQAICFDIDGTLADTDDAVVKRLAQGLLGLAFLFPGKDPHAFARRVVMGLETPGNVLFGLLGRLGVDGLLAPLIDGLHRLRGESDSHRFLIIPEVPNLLESLASRYPLAVVSARERRSTMAFLEAFELLPFFRCVATAHTCRRTKPHPAPVLWAAQQMGVPSQACLMVGDTTVDIRAGVAAGAQTVGVLCGFGERDELEACGADLILETTADLHRWLIPPKEESEPIPIPLGTG